MRRLLKKTLYSIAGMWGVSRLGLAWRGRACILCYHRVLPDDKVKTDKGPDSSLVMSVSMFEEQMKFLSETYRVLSMDDFLKHIESDSNEFVIVITFDDGYKDNLVYALPILEKYKIPSTIYIITRLPQGDTWMWWYEIWDHLNTVQYLAFNDKNRNFKWNLSTQRRKLICFNDLSKMMLDISSDECKLLLKKITKNIDLKKYTEICLDWGEIQVLDRHPLITIGAHSHTHPNLNKLSREDSLTEMLSSKFLLEEKLKHSVDHFAYPYGTKNEATQREFEMIIECGFHTAVTTRLEKLERPNLNRIPRTGVPPFLSLQGFKGKISGLERIAR